MIFCIFDSQGDLAYTPPKHFSHDLQNIFGIWVCKRCTGEGKTMEIIQSKPCNPAIIESMKQIETDFN